MLIFVMLNNLFHDLAVAFLFASMMILASIYKMGRAEDFENRLSVIREIYRRLSKIMLVSWIFILAAGAIRAVFYEEFEWLPALGRDQVMALILKHIFLIALIVGGGLLQFRLRKRLFSSNA